MLDSPARCFGIAGLVLALAGCGQSDTGVSVVVDNPQIMMEQKGDQILKWFGAPGFQRKEGPSQLWRYSSKNCVLELFLFRKGEPGATEHTVSHYEMRPRPGAELTDRLCLAEIALSRED